MDTGHLLEQHQLRKTDFRKEVLEIFLSKKGRALSNSDIEFELSDPDRITLYRTLKSFEAKGLIHQAIDGSGINKYALCESDCNQHVHHDKHAHFHCQKCGDTICLNHSLNDLKYQTPRGLYVESVEVILKGTCSACT